MITLDITKKLVDFCRHKINNLAIILELLKVRSLFRQNVSDLLITIYLSRSDHRRLWVQVISISWNKERFDLFLRFENGIVSKLSSGQHSISVSQNQSIVLDDNTRDILNTLGGSLSNLGVSASQIQSLMSTSEPIDKKPTKPHHKYLSL